MLYYRRKLLLAVLEVFERKLPSRMIQKYLFLVTRGSTTNTFDFVPYKYGCYSFQAAQDLAVLSQKGMIQEIEIDGHNGFMLNPEVHLLDQIELFDRQKLFDIKRDFSGYTQEQLIRYTYINYPFFAINSVIAPNIITSEEAKKNN